MPSKPPPFDPISDLDPTAAAAFLNGRPPPPSTPPDAPPPRKVKTLKDGRVMRATTVVLPVEIGKRLDVYAAEREVNKSDVIAEALAHWFDRS